ncbi:uncharacterized protein N0V89_010598 [Didymosphaeria variabile]|uniref:Uncharacterized protein n=1 Tax=Didymosphaeria variabile TaxID=1932322 RepID=A0A9W8XD76_9PLEO|nr:uncharacterized protein N0V89_010598 [Didymosphaeria variabile]KAJ4346667.1 hypothetical protein N0V89_010598 [Didymosphaeria variabile]
MTRAGLYLPHTLSRLPDRTETHTVRQKYLERKSSQDSDSDRKSIALSRMSSEDVTKVFSSLPTVFDFADWVSTQGRVSSDNGVFIELLQRVRHDVTEASRLYTSRAVTEYLESWPDKKAYIDKILHDIEKALNDIGQFLETVQVSGDDGGTVSLRRKFQWGHFHQKKLGNKQQLLATCHQSLMPAVQLMQAVEMKATLDPIHELPEHPRVEGVASDVFISPHYRQQSSLNRRSSSVPSIAVSEPDLKEGKIVRPYQHTFAELPGSTPDDLHHFDEDLHVDYHESRDNARDQVHAPSPARDDAQSPSRFAAVNSSTRPMTADASVATVPRRRPPDPPLTRRSVDHVRPSLSFFDDRARASFDSARPRAYSEQIRTQRSFEIKSRSSYDQVQPLPTLTERPIERFNSTASIAVGDAISVPLAPMRYRSKPINVRKPPVKHKSLPSALPSFPSQMSLLDDLSTWIIPQSARESYRSTQSIDTISSTVETTPATSVTSSPTVPTSPALLDAAAVASVPTSVVTPESSLKKALTEPTPVLKFIPSLPSRSAPARPLSDLPPPIPPKIPLTQSSQPEAVSQSRSDDILRRMPSDPIPSPYVRRRRPAAPSNSTFKRESSDVSLVPAASSMSVTPTSAPIPSSETAIETKSPEPTSKGKLPPVKPRRYRRHASSNASAMDDNPTAVLPSNISNDAHSSMQPPAKDEDGESSTEFKQSIHHTASNATTTDKYPIAVSFDNAPPVPALSTQSLPTVMSASSAASRKDVHHTFSNASATDKYPISILLDNPPPVPSLPLQSPPISVNSIEIPDNETSSPPTTARPMTALAKRRAAHAKRMQMAFGTESENA